VAARGSLLYFLVDRLNVLNHMYQYSMAMFVEILNKGIDATPAADDPAQRVTELIEATSFTIFKFVASGLFEKHKLIFATQYALSLMRQTGTLDVAMAEYLLQGPRVPGVTSPLPEWMSDATWGAVLALRDIDEFGALPDDVIGSAKRWRDWAELERPESEALPGDWKKLSDFQRLQVIRALRPDRMTNAVHAYVSSTIGPQYVQSYPFNLEKSFEDAKPGTPIFIFLSPGVDAAAAVEGLGRKLGFTAESGKYAAVSLGQGQEGPATKALQRAQAEGGWVLLQNIHLTPKWTAGPLEKMIDKLAEGAHGDFRLFLSAEPSPGIPINVLQNSIKLSNEPPEGVQPNLVRAFGNFSDETFEGSSKSAELKAIVFALSFFHGVLLERKKFGPQVRTILS
jgi:dynein heavy chain